MKLLQDFSVDDGWWEVMMVVCNWWRFGKVNESWWQDDSCQIFVIGFMIWFRITFIIWLKFSNKPIEYPFHLAQSNKSMVIICHGDHWFFALIHIQWFLLLKFMCNQVSTPPWASEPYASKGPPREDWSGQPDLPRRLLWRQMGA